MCKLLEVCGRISIGSYLMTSIHASNVKEKLSVITENKNESSSCNNGDRKLWGNHVSIVIGMRLLYMVVNSQQLNLCTD